MKKIAFFSGTMHIGGMEKSLVVLLNKLIYHYDVTLFLESKDGDLLSKLDDKVKVIEYKLSNHSNIFIRKLHNFIKRYFWYLTHFHKYDFSCCYATYSRICSLLSLKAAKNNAIYIHSNYYDMFRGDINKIKKFYKYVNVPSFKKIIYVSNESLESINKVLPYFKNKSYVINNLFDFPYKNYRNKENTSDGKYRYLFIGRIEEASKNLKRLLDAFQLLIRKQPNCVLTIVGDGPDYLKIKDYAKHLNIENKVIFKGKLINPDNEIKKNNFVVLSSNYEGNPVVYMEAIYYKKPIVTTVKTSDKYIDVEKYGIVCKKNPQDLFWGMQQIINKKIIYDIDFSLINERKIQDIIQLIERRQ